MPTIAIHVSDGFPILSLTLVTEPLRIANREIGRDTFRWRIVSDDGEMMSSSSGFGLSTEPLPGIRPDAIALLASYRPERAATQRTLAWLRAMDRAGCLMGCVDTGALVFARAGLLTKRPAAVHPEAVAAFSRQFPQSLFVDRLFDFSPPRFSSAGGISTIDMTLALIGHMAGGRLAQRVATILTYDRIHGDRLVGDIAGMPLEPELRTALSLMRANLANPLPVSVIAARCNVPGWRLTRLFRRRLHQAPTSYYVSLRLERAREMLRNSTLGVGDIATECGYDNIETFSRGYKAKYGCAPSRDRVL